MKRHGSLNLLRGESTPTMCSSPRRSPPDRWDGAARPGLRGSGPAIRSSGRSGETGATTRGRCSPSSAATSTVAERSKPTDLSALGCASAALSPRVRQNTELVLDRPSQEQDLLTGLLIGALKATPRTTEVRQRLLATAWPGSDPSRAGAGEGRTGRLPWFGHQLIAVESLALPQPCTRGPSERGSSNMRKGSMNKLALTSR